MAPRPNRRSTLNRHLSSSSASPWSEWEDSICALTELGKAEDALRTIEQAQNRGHDPAALLVLLEALERRVPLGLDGLRLRLRLLGNAGQVAQLEAAAQFELTQVEAQHRRPAAFLYAYLAFAHLQREAHGSAKRQAEQALEDTTALQPHERLLAWRMIAIARYCLDPESDWVGPLHQALEKAQGRTRALVLTDLGGLQSRTGNEVGAMLAFAEALTLTRHPDDRAELLNNMSLVCLRSGQLSEAEEYAQQAAALRTGLLSRALSGQAAARRALGEWSRAASLYERAAAVARTSGDEDDLRQALRGLGHTQRLANQVMTAVVTLRSAAQATAADRASGRSWVNVDLAAAIVAAPGLDAAQVQRHLEQTGTLAREDAERASIVRAELDRREGRPEQARERLLTLNPAMLWVREEAHAFPLLFGLLDPALRPEGLPRLRQYEVALRVLGFPEVQLNGRRLTLAPLPLVMLTALIEAGGELTTDELTDVLRDQTPRRPRLASQRVSRVARLLDRALGWPGSIQALRGRYLLDPAAHWSIDSVLAKREGRAAEAYLSGINLPWALEREQQLRQSD